MDTNRRRFLLGLISATAVVPVLPAIPVAPVHGSDPLTREHVKQMLERLLEPLKHTNRLYDYMVMCDERNNTPAMIDQDLMKVDVYVKRALEPDFIVVSNEDYKPQNIEHLLDWARTLDPDTPGLEVLQRRMI